MVMELSTVSFLTYLVLDIYINSICHTATGVIFITLYIYLFFMIILAIVESLAFFLMHK